MSATPSSKSSRSPASPSPGSGRACRGCPERPCGATSLGRRLRASGPRARRGASSPSRLALALPSVVEGDLAGARRARRSRRRARARRPSARPRAPRARPRPRCAASSSGRVGVPSRRSVPAILPVSIVAPEQSRTSSAIWNAMPSARPYSPRAAAEPARGLEELPGLERAALEVRLDGRRRVVRLRALQRLAAREAERRVGEDRDRARRRRSRCSSANARAKR